MLELQRIVFYQGLFTFIVVPAIAILLGFVAPSNLVTVKLTHSFFHTANIIQLHRSPDHFPNPPYTLFSTRVVLPSKKIKPSYILITSEGKIHDLLPSLARTPSEWRKVVVDVSPLVVMPGLIDPHVHVNAPGREEWEGFERATRAAAAGGTTTILDMPLNNVPSTIDEDSLETKIKAWANSDSVVDVGLIGGIVHGNKESIRGLIDGGVLALKSFMIDSQSVDFPHVTATDLKDAVIELNRIFSNSNYVGREVPYILHAELDDFGPETGSRAITRDSFDHTSYEDYEKSRPHSWETNAVDLAASIANNTRVHIHIAHVSSHYAAQRIFELQRSSSFKGKITAETCTHYLVWAKEEIPPGSTSYKCAPPIRSATNRDKLRSYLFGTGGESASLDFVSSDHSPCPPELKGGKNLTEAWGGISGLQYRLQGTWSVAKELNVTIVQLSDILSGRPASVFGIDSMKGVLKSGLDADLLIWDPERKVVLNGDNCLHRHKLSAFHGHDVRGEVHYTLLRGRPVYNRKSVSLAVTNTYLSPGRLLMREKRDGTVFQKLSNEFSH